MNCATQQLETFLSQGCTVICFLDYYKLYPKETPKYPYGHVVILTGYDKESIFFHENTPRHSEPNKKMQKEAFSKVWVNPDGTFGDTIVAWPKKPQKSE